MYRYDELKKTNERVAYAQKQRLEKRIDLTKQECTLQQIKEKSNFWRELKAYYLEIENTTERELIQKQFDDLAQCEEQLVLSGQELVDLPLKVQQMHGSLKESVLAKLYGRTKVFLSPKDKSFIQEKRGRPATDIKQDEEQTAKKKH